MAGFASFVCIAILYWLICRESSGTSKMKEIAGYIQEGANAFLRREFKTISYFIATLAALLLTGLGWQIAFGFVMGAVFSLIAILLGMNAAVRANVRTTNAARTSASKALSLAFRGGGVMGLSIVSLNLVGISLLYLFFGADSKAVVMLVGFGFGASLSALFAQLGGGIFTKAADVGADLVGKVEEHIPEDDPRNPAVIADQVGDNVGDCAGRGADLFESGSDNLIAAMILGLIFVGPPFLLGWKIVLFPLLTRAIANIGTIVGVFAVRGWKKHDPILSLNVGLFLAGAVCIVVNYPLAVWIMNDIRFFWCLLLGLLSALAVSLIVEYYTGINRKPVRKIAEAAQSGAALNIMTGFAYGMESAAIPIIVIGGVIIASYFIFGGGILGVYGIVTAALGLTQMKGIIMASDTFGPIVDNASGIAEMSGLGNEVRHSADMLDACGNITKAITKGFAMVAAILTSAALLFAYVSEAFKLESGTGAILVDISKIAENFDLAHPLIIVGILIGATIPFLFSALTIFSVGKTAHQMVDEVRRQFNEIDGILEGKTKPDYSRCVDVSTKNALREMIPPTLLGLTAPIIIGLTLGIWALGAFLLSATVVGALLATFMFNAGGALDNAKKYIENGYLEDKRETTRAAAVIGDIFGDPLKDTAGPSLHILIKLVNIVAITLLPFFVAYALL